MAEWRWVKGQTQGTGRTQKLEDDVAVGGGS